MKNIIDNENEEIINSDKIKELYEKSILKWKEIAEEFDEISKSAGTRCSFCKFAIYEHCYSPNDLSAACDICHINHDICDCNMSIKIQKEESLYHKVIASLKISEDNIKKLIQALKNERNRL